MLKTMKLLAVLFTATILFSLGSCGEGALAKTDSSDISNAIPADATGVLLMNTKQLMEKVDYATLKETSFFKDFIEEAKKESPEMVPFLENPEAAGINMAGNMGLYFSIPEEMKDEKDLEIAFMLPIADKAKMDAAVAIALKEVKDVTSETKDGYTITALESNGFLIQGENILAFTSFNDDAKVKELLNPTGESIRTNANFAKQVKESKDVLFWMNADPIVAVALKDPQTSMQIKGALAIAQIPEEGLKGNFMSFFYDFQKGEMNAGTSFDFSEVLIRELGEIFPTKLAVDYSKYIPTEKLAASMTFGINSEGVLNFMAKRGLNQMVDQYLESVNLDLGKIKEGITGDMAVGVYAPADQANDPAMVFALGLKDKAFMEGLIGLAGNAITKDGDKYTFTGQQSMMDPTAAPLQLFATIKDDVILVSNSNAHLDLAIAGTSNNVVGELQTGWMGMFVDYNIINDNYDVIANYLPIDPASLNMSKMMSEYQSVNTVTVVGKGSNVTGKTMMKDATVNSLKSLMESMDKMYQNKDELEAQMKSQMKDEFEGFDDFEEKVEEVTENT
jgi:hypothetical protein